MAVLRWAALEPGEWDQRFLLALGLSFMLHVLLLSLSLPHKPANRIPGASALTAVLMRAPAAGQTASATPQHSETGTPDEQKALVREQSPVSIQTRRKETTPQGNSRRIAGATHPGEGVSPLRSEQGPSGKETRTELKPGEVNVIFLVRDDGHVGQILWKRLPAMTYAQLERIEALIRARKLPGAISGQVRRETINIQALIEEIEGRKPARDEKAAPEPVTD
jgi:hypothetical protein